MMTKNKLSSSTIGWIVHPSRSNNGRGLPIWKISQVMTSARNQPKTMCDGQMDLLVTSSGHIFVTGRSNGLH